ncbi:hypothetical protein EHS25_009807 [Saitozyma podzolica]|uniref:Mitochondrial import inner membrane translocase subunit TIM16 n=1 Tax=Saitozyma podzolica TaxID=1890683 RepID=A0A427YK82_9TREE|nr:hypothetical protein EHS25_009807 [Saitozyma podzolica]
MSAPRIIAEMVVTGIRVLGKATAAAGQQAVRNFKHKPEGAPSSAPVGTGSSKSQITSQLQMSLDEAHQILNVKKDEPMDVIQKSYERIFKANGPPPEPAPSASGKQPAGAARKKGTTHSHYLQSKVFRALERIQAERGELPGSGPGAGTGTGTGAAANGAAAAGEGSAASAAGSTGAGGAAGGASEAAGR